MTDLDSGPVLSESHPEHPSSGPVRSEPRRRLVLKPKKLFFFLLLIGAVFGMLALALPPYFFRSHPLEKMISQSIEQISGGKFSYKTFTVSYFPRLSVRFDQVELHSLSPAAIDMQAKSLSVRMARLPMLIGRFRVGAATIFEAKGAVEVSFEWGKEIIAFENFHGKAGPVQPGKVIRAEFSGAFPGGQNLFTLKAGVVVDSLENPSWAATAVHGTFAVDKLNVGLLKKDMRRLLNFEPAGGEAASRWSFSKELEDSWIQMESETQIHGFAYRLSEDLQQFSSPVFDVQLSSQAGWNPGTETLKVDRLLLSVPAGNFEVSGEVRTGTREIQDLRLSAQKIVLETIPQYILGLKEVIPLNIGFSGMSDFEMSLSGTWDHLSIHAHSDLTQALLTYARYFSKPKELPLNIALDYLLKDGHLLSGDFSVRLKGATMKGSLTDVDLKSGMGQINLITNKFDLAGWETLVPPLQNYKLSGAAKLLANFKGNLQRLDENASTFNLSLENAGIKDASGTGFDQVHLAMDISPMSFEIRDSRFTLGENQLTTNLLVYTSGAKPLLEFGLESEKLEPALFGRTVQALADPWLSQEVRDQVGAVRRGLEEWFPAGQAAEKVEMRIKSGAERLEMPRLSFDILGGRVLMSGARDLTLVQKPYRLDFNAQKISLAQWARLGEHEDLLLEGNLFLKGQVRGGEDSASAPVYLDGEGALLITNGELHSIDIFHAISEIPGFSDLEKNATGGTAFHDLHSGFKITGSKWVTQDLTVLGNDFTIQGNGEFGLDRFLNYRLDVFFDETLLPGSETGGSFNPAADEPQFLGPVPLLLSGPLNHPELKRDPARSPDLRRELERKKSNQPLRNFLPEETFAEPAAKA